MNQEVVLFLIGQGVVILIAAGTAFWGISAKIATLRADVAHYAEQRREALERHVELARQVQGMSRTVERHDTLIETQIAPFMARTAGR